MVRNGGVQGTWRPTRSTVSVTYTEAVPVQKSLWKSIIIVVTIKTIMAMKITKNHAFNKPPNSSPQSEYHFLELVTLFFC
ncbi:growth-regulating factor 1 [Phtheirospermum japonicum]|uniref:Growth-regulating factor 1 n=1 Tax=Phtheirospermum japonicum TaxID=374723 RepID=A0A830BHY7_9LAMI|nr:growth-regulating factor 1 [Phtheirospermum japonicum]